MAKRAWVLRPDEQVTGIGPDGEDILIASVSLGAMQQAMLEAAVFVHRGGGVASVVASRVETGFPNERVTSAAIVEWKDRTDARPQAESDGPAILAEPEPTEEMGFHEPLVVPRGDLTADVAPGLSGVEVDESSVPVALREG